MNPWEKGTPLDKMVRKQEHADKDISFEQRAERYREDAERVIHGEKLATLARGFVTGCGGKGNVKAEDCERFVKDHRAVINRAMDTVPEDDYPPRGVCAGTCPRRGVASCIYSR